MFKRTKRRKSVLSELTRKQYDLLMSDISDYGIASPFEIRKLRNSKNFKKIFGNKQRVWMLPFNAVSDDVAASISGDHIDGISAAMYNQIIDDMNMHIAKQYGMIHPNASDSKAVRAVFIIDPAGVIRAILYYPLTTGRNMDEILRLLTALQTTDAFGVSTPADWRPGDDILVPAPSTTTAMHNRIDRPERDLDVRAWFLALKKLPEQTVMEKLNKKSVHKRDAKK